MWSVSARVGAIEPSVTLTSLLSLIKQDPHDETSKQRQQRLVQKLDNAAQISFAERTLQQDHIRLLAKMNNEAKVRRSTKSVVLGKAKVMSYKDIEARAKRAEEAAAAQGKRGRRCGSAAPEQMCQSQRLRWRG
ncbi:uncharacterized protein BDZ99DRAFT_465360 [Mytilinidion resinicola]|uniref:Uncharacterized protein n=1 Tax=Mytilinidion resinicola TaxID=574789 RepID=A0A6A6YG01_9PEZI|nr:uncharacterized protein BDZ99DRAFT_465360 [Mytilinidion resinicola]KAF2807498.1 hypothetical protein BDZ99DRAFT_465360 [Mytilinidion resinicola]